MASSAQDTSSYGATAAPPPTPSAPPNHRRPPATSDATCDALSRLLLNRLLTSPPSLTLPSRLSAPKPTVVVSPPKLSLQPGTNLHLAEISELAGFFQLSGHSIPSDLAKSAELEALSLFDLPRTEKQQIFSNKTTWPLGYDDGGEDEAGPGESFCLDDSCFAESTTRPSLVSLHALTREMEKLGSQIVDSVFEKGASGSCCSLMWVCRGGGGGGGGDDGNKAVFSGRFYPNVVALEYQIRREQEWSLLGDSGWVCVSPEVDSVLVTIGDIAQVWSNGKLKKVRGKRPVAAAAHGGDEDGTRRCITMSLLMTLPTDSNVSVSPLLLQNTNNVSDDDDHGDDETKAVFNTFSFEDYAWRVYHERFPFKDPLDRHRT